ncbi:hypothetical protein KAT72_21495 [Aeromonas popoffii]|uniref:Uncharacterized protein n=1 Tax=Aeromonas popoffii TaxID=70856 RepID=A0ABS5GWJ1_9GAMM|nr:hypothetical protein [Aeromonas popoffii]MBR7631493.1 hypothetical protein [Aeromonas popoffii]
MAGFYVDGIEWDDVSAERAIDIAYFNYCYKVNKDADFHAFESKQSKDRFLRQDIALAVKITVKLKKLIHHAGYNGGDILPTKNNPDALYKALLNASVSFMLDREKLVFIEGGGRAVDFFWSLLHMYSVDAASYRDGRTL